MRRPRLALPALLAALALPLLALPLLALPTTAGAATTAAARSGYQLRHIPDFSYPVSPGLVVERWNPCAPIRYAVDLAGAPRGALAEVHAAVAAAHAATGIVFTDVGTTAATSHSVPAPGGGLQLDTKPLRAAHLDLLIEWQSRAVAHSLLVLAGADAAGVGLTIAGGSWSQTGSVLTRHPTRILSAVVALDSAQAGRIAAPGRDAHGNGLRELLMHELGHVLGLEHPTEGGQIMDPVLRQGGPTAYAPGDRAGLRLLGTSAGCLPATVVQTAP